MEMLPLRTMGFNIVWSLQPLSVFVAVTDEHLVWQEFRSGIVNFSSWLGTHCQNRINIESAPNVEYGKMRSEPDECALGADFRVIDSTFYFS